RAQRRSNAAVVLTEQAERVEAVVGVTQLAEAAFGPRAQVRRRRYVAGRSAEVELVAVAAVALRRDGGCSPRRRERRSRPSSRQYRSHVRLETLCSCAGDSRPVMRISTATGACLTVS